MSFGHYQIAEAAVQTTPIRFARFIFHLLAK